MTEEMKEMSVLEISDARGRVERRIRARGWEDDRVHAFLAWIVATRFPAKGMITHPEMKAIEDGLDALAVEWGKGT